MNHYPDFELHAGKVELKTGQGVRLECYHQRPQHPSRGRIILLHGWEGCHASGYIVSMAIECLREGWEVVRVNFRDHGYTHHLNEAPFHSARLQEVVDVAQAWSPNAYAKPVVLIGFSLGGNFALRIASQLGGSNTPITKVFAISPVIDPQAAVIQMRNTWFIYRWYFLQKWKRSLQAKQRAFPGTLPYNEAININELDARTEFLIKATKEFDSLKDYYREYTLDQAFFDTIQLPVEVITAEDDPVIPASGWDSIKLPKSIKLKRTRHGGHCGFLDHWAEPSLCDRYCISHLRSLG